MTRSIAPKRPPAPALRSALTVASVCFAVAWAPSAWAGDIARQGDAAAPPARTEADAPVPVEALDQVLRRAGRSASIWHWTWIGLFSANVAAQGVRAGLADERNERIALGISAIPSAAGVAMHFIRPLRALSADDYLKALAHDDAADPPAARIELLREFAASEDKERGWFAHVGTVAINLGVAGVMWLALDEPVKAAIQAGGGIVVGEIRIWTAPRTANDFLDERGDSAPLPALTVAPIVAGGFVGIGGRFSAP